MFCDSKNKIIQHKNVKLKTIQKLINKIVEPKCQNELELINNNFQFNRNSAHQKQETPLTAMFFARASYGDKCVYKA